MTSVNPPKLSVVFLTYLIPLSFATQNNVIVILTINHYFKNYSD
jgi:hypothetical protein